MANIIRQSGRHLDWDGEALKLVRNAYDLSAGDQDQYHEQYEKDWLLYLAYGEAIDPELPNVQLPKLFAIVEQKSAAMTKALFGRRPVIEYTARREEFKEAAEIQTELLDDLLQKARLYVEGSLLSKLSIVYGTSFMNVIPYYKMVTERSVIIDPLTGAPRVIKQKAPRLRLKIETWAPWEILHDPAATGLEDPDDCRYVIKVQIASKSQIRRMAEMGAYPDLDLDKLEEQATDSIMDVADHWGREMLQAYGLSDKADDDDIGVLLRYESPERYVDIWNGGIVLRDIDNPYEHGQINLSRMVHVTNPHTQARFLGIGEAKPNEVQISMLNDLWNMTFAAHGLMNQPVIMYRSDAIDDADDLVWSLGNRIPLSSTSDRPISDDVIVSAGTGLPKEHYLLPQAVERNIDLAAGEFSPNRGEVGDSDTATEFVGAMDMGAQRNEESTRLGELVFLADFGPKASAIVEQFSNLNDVIEIVGQEKAMKLLSANPADLPGGFNFNFKGSDMVANLVAKQAALRAMAEVLMVSPAARPGGVERALLELHDFRFDEIEKMLMTDEELAIKLQQEALLNVLLGVSQNNAQAPTPTAAAGGNKPAKNKKADGYASTQNTGRQVRNGRQG